MNSNSFAQSITSQGETANVRHSLTEPVHVVCAANSSYAMPMTVMLASLVDNFSQQRDLVIHIISNDSTASDKENVRNSIKIVRPTLSHIEIKWHLNEGLLPENLHFPREGHFSRDTFARLFIPDIIQDGCERAIYLDCDMVVLADISMLYDSTAWNDSIIHATHDLGIPWVSSQSGVFDYEDRGIPADAENFSTAVLVINLKRWRERNLTPELLGYLAAHGDKVYVDQGALNAFLWREWVRLDNRWNQGSDVLFEEIWLAAGYTHEEWKLAKNHPYIVHYAGGSKPWKRGVPYPRFSYFYHYLSKTTYKGSVRLAPHLEVFVGFRIYYQIWRSALNIKGLVRHFFPGLFKPTALMSRHQQNIKAKNSKKAPIT